MVVSITMCFVVLYLLGALGLLAVLCAASAAGDRQLQEPVAIPAKPLVRRGRG